MNTDDLYQIGELSRYFNIPIKTLRYYEEQGIIAPAYVSSSNYRYYTPAQFPKLRLVLYLRRIGIPLKDIKSIISCSDARKSYTAALENRKKFLADRMKDDQFAISTLNMRLMEISQSFDSPKNVVIFRTLPANRFVLFPYNYRSRIELEEGLREFRKNTSLDWRFARVGQVLSKGNFEEGSFFDYCGILISSPTLYDYKEKSHLVHYPDREYAMIYCTRKTDECGPFWVTLRSEIERNGYAPCGDAVRSLILEDGIGDAGQYLACIKVPVTKRI